MPVALLPTGPTSRANVASCANVAASNSGITAVYDLQLHTQKRPNLFELSHDMTYAQGIMVRRSLLAPSVHEGCSVQRKPQSAVSVTDFQALPRQRFSFRRQELEAAIARLGQTQDHDGAFAIAGLTAHPITALAMITGISDLSFAFGQANTPSALSSQANLAIASFGWYRGSL